MATDEQKEKALKDAIEIAKVCAAAGIERGSPAKIIRETYREIIKIHDAAG